MTLPPGAHLVVAIVAFTLFVGMFGPARVSPILMDKNWVKPKDLSRNPELNFGLPGYEKDCTLSSSTRAQCYMVPCSYAEMCMAGTKFPYYKSPLLDMMADFGTWKVERISVTKKTCADLGYVAAFEDVAHPRGVSYTYIPEESYSSWLHTAFGGQGGLLFYVAPMLVRGTLRNVFFGGQLSELISHAWMLRFLGATIVSTSIPLAASWWWLVAPFQGGEAPPMECTYGDAYGSWTYVSFFTAYIKEGGTITNPYGAGYLRDRYLDTRK